VRGILDDIDFHVAKYNSWSDQLLVVMGPKTFYDMTADAQNWSFTSGVTNWHVWQIGGVKVEILPGIPDGEWLIVGRPHVPDWVTFR
jgi:hypothetical protein